MAKSTISIQKATEDFLYNRLQHNPAADRFIKTGEIPACITNNINKTLRPYQKEAVCAFIWQYQHHTATEALQLLFNMATGTGKTLIMACCVLYLYAEGYRNFLFMVSRVKILEQAIDNFTNPNSPKYLFNRDGVVINGERVAIVQSDTAGEADALDNQINFIFTSTQTLASIITEPRENCLTVDDFRGGDDDGNNKNGHSFVILADEAHHLNSQTSNPRETRENNKDNKSWEHITQKIVQANRRNVLLEFTATVDLKNEGVRDKYRDHLVYKYDFVNFRVAGYSKDVLLLQTPETDIAQQKRLLIVNAVAFSEFRKLYAERVYGITLNPIILFKSRSIDECEADRDYFNEVIETLELSDFDFLKRKAAENQTAEKSHQYEMIHDMLDWVKLPLKNHGLSTTYDGSDGLNNFLKYIRSDFGADSTTIYNSKVKENADQINNLDALHNKIRAVFSVDALNEGWDVLSLFDIVVFSIGYNKKVAAADIQLIGRGARYFPFELPRQIAKQNKDNNLAFDFDNGTAGIRNVRDMRKFDNDPYNTGRCLETLTYNFVNSGTFAEKFKAELQGNGIIDRDSIPVTIKMKPEFMASDTYRRGAVILNTLVRREFTSEDEIFDLTHDTVYARPPELYTNNLTDNERNAERRNTRYHEYKGEDNITTVISRRVIQKALMRAEHNFFRYYFLVRHIPDLRSIDDFIDHYLARFTISYEYVIGKELDNLSEPEQLQLLVGGILPKIRERIERSMPIYKGSDMVPVRLSDVIKPEKTVFIQAQHRRDGSGRLVKYSDSERAKGQSDEYNAEWQYDVSKANWYAYDENYGTSEEKKFAKWLAGEMAAVRDKYPNCEIYLIRNELDYSIYSPRDGRRFAPDYLLIINDTVHHRLYSQFVIEPKGGDLLEHDKWKEKFLDQLERVPILTGGQVNMLDKYERMDIESRYQTVQNVGLKFFNADRDANGGQAKLRQFTADFERKVLGR